MVDVARSRVGDEPVREALAAPVDGEDRKPRGRQAAGGGGVFLEILGAALKEQHGGARRPLGAPEAEAQADAVAGGDEEGLGGGEGVVGVLVEVPVMLTLVAMVNRSKGWYEQGQCAA